MMKRYLLVLCLCLVPASAFAQNIATAITDAPIYLRADVNLAPVRVAAPGSQLKVLQLASDWIQVQFNDPELGLRVGWVQRRHVRVIDESLQPMDLSVPDSKPAPATPPGLTGDFPAAETGIGWSFLHWSEGELLDVNSPVGWNVSVAGNITPWAGIVGDVSGNYKSELFEVEGATWKAHAFLGGPRFSLRVSPTVVPYAQFLLGYVRTDATALDEDFGSNDIGIQPGGGVDIGRGKAAARIEIGWRTVFYEEESQTQFRFVLGVVIRSGPR